jgi:ABC-type transport system substrate-binding protein
MHSRRIALGIALTLALALLAAFASSTSTRDVLAVAAQTGSGDEAGSTGNDPTTTDTGTTTDPENKVVEPAPDKAPVGATDLARTGPASTVTIAGIGLALAAVGFLLVGLTSTGGRRRRA